MKLRKGQVKPQWGEGKWVKATSKYLARPLTRTNGKNVTWVLRQQVGFKHQSIMVLFTTVTNCIRLYRSQFLCLDRLFLYLRNVRFTLFAPKLADNWLEDTLGRNVGLSFFIFLMLGSHRSGCLPCCHSGYVFFMSGCVCYSGVSCSSARRTWSSWCCACKSTSATRSSRRTRINLCRTTSVP